MAFDEMGMGSKGMAHEERWAQASTQLPHHLQSELDAVSCVLSRWQDLLEVACVKDALDVVPDLAEGVRKVWLDGQLGLCYPLQLPIDAPYFHLSKEQCRFTRMQMIGLTPVRGDNPIGEAPHPQQAQRTCCAMLCEHEPHPSGQMRTAWVIYNMVQLADDKRLNLDTNAAHGGRVLATSLIRMGSSVPGPPVSVPVCPWSEESLVKLRLLVSSEDLGSRTEEPGVTPPAAPERQHSMVGLARRLRPCSSDGWVTASEKCCKFSIAPSCSCAPAC